MFYKQATSLRVEACFVDDLLVLPLETPLFYAKAAPVCEQIEHHPVGAAEPNSNLEIMSAQLHRIDQPVEALAP
jgi:hypothetical protein